MTLNGRIHKLSVEEKMRLLQPIAKLSMEIDPYYRRQKRRPRTLAGFWKYYKVCNKKWIDSSAIPPTGNGILHCRHPTGYTGWAKKVSLLIFVITLSTVSQFSRVHPNKSPLKFLEKRERRGRIQGLSKFFGYPLLSQAWEKLRISNLASTFRGSFRTKVH